MKKMIRKRIDSAVRDVLCVHLRDLLFSYTTVLLNEFFDVAPDFLDVSYLKYLLFTDDVGLGIVDLFLSDLNESSSFDYYSGSDSALRAFLDKISKEV